MRRDLIRLMGERAKFTAVFDRFGMKLKSKSKKTVLLKNLKYGDEVLADHVWLSKGKQFEELGDLKQGQSLEFYARVKFYVKGKEKNVIDIRLSHVSKLRTI